MLQLHLVGGFREEKHKEQMKATDSYHQPKEKANSLDSQICSVDHRNKNFPGEF